jgi:hypothetical protein
MPTLMVAATGPAPRQQPPTASGAGRAGEGWHVADLEVTPSQLQARSTGFLAEAMQLRLESLNRPIL